MSHRRRHAFTSISSIMPFLRHLTPTLPTTSLLLLCGLVLASPPTGAQINPYAEISPTPATQAQQAPVEYRPAPQTPIVVDAAVPVDLEVEELVEELRQPLERYAHTVCPLGHNLAARGRNGALGHLLATATLEAARELAPPGVAIDFAIMNSGGVRADLSGDLVTEGCLLRVMPFANTVVAVRLEGERREAFLRRLAEQDSRFMLANARIYYTRKPITYALHRMDGSPWPEGPIVVALSNYLATGGDGLDMLIDAPRVIESDVLVRDALRKKLLRLTNNGTTPLEYSPPDTMVRNSSTPD